MKTNVWIIVNFLLCLNTPKLGIRQLFLKPLESWPSIVVRDGEWWWLWSLLVVHYTVRVTLPPKHFPLIKTYERAPPIFYRKSPWDGISIKDFFFISPCLRRSRREASGLVASATSSAEWRPLWRLDQNRKLRMKSLWHPGRGYVRVGTIPYFSFISGISCQYWVGAWLPWRYWWCG